MDVGSEEAEKGEERGGFHSIDRFWRAGKMLGYLVCLSVHQLLELLLVQELTHQAQRDKQNDKQNSQN